MCDVIVLKEDVCGAYLHVRMDNSFVCLIRKLSNGWLVVYAHHSSGSL